MGPVGQGAGPTHGGGPAPDRPGDAVSARPEGSETAICDACHQPLAVGDWPYCPHGRPLLPLRYRQDQVPGGLVIENLGPRPIRFDSHSEKRAYMRAHGIREFIQHVGVPGTDKSPHTQRWI